MRNARQLLTLNRVPHHRYWLMLLIIGVFTIPLAALELSIDSGFIRLNNITEQIQPGFQEAQDHLPARAFIGFGIKQRINPKLKLGVKFIYGHRDFGEPSSDLQSRAGYIDIMVHPAVRLSSMELFAGPTLAAKVSSRHTGGLPSYSDAMVEDFATLVPGFHAGVQYPADPEANVSFDVTYNRDLKSFSDALGTRKHQERVMLGVNLRLLERGLNTRTIWQAVDRIPTEKRTNFGISLSTQKEDFTFTWDLMNELVKRFGPVGIGGEFELSMGSILPEETFGMFLRMMAGPQLGIKVGAFEPYIQNTWGVLPLLIFEEDNKDSGLHLTDAMETGLRLHFSREIAMDMRFRRQNYYSGKQIDTIGIGMSLNSSW